MRHDIFIYHWRVHGKQVFNRGVILFEPSMQQYLTSCRPIFRVHLKHFLKYILALIAHTWECSNHFADLTFAVLIENFLVVITRKQIAASQHVIEHNSNAKNVAFIVVALSSKQFWRCITGRPAFLVKNLCIVRKKGG